MISQPCSIKSRALLFCVALACVCSWGCYGRRDQSPVVPSQQAISQSARTYALGREPDQEREQAFQNLLAAAYAAALDMRGAPPETGLSYSLSPKGAVYSFSEVEVACLVQKADSSRGKALCREFFKAVDAGLEKVIMPK